MNINKTILSLCDYTGIWSEPYREAGYFVVQVDLNFGHDVRTMIIPDYPIHGIIAQPPCTHLASSGARWWEAKGDTALYEALSIVDACLRFVAICRPCWWVLENPIGRLARFLGSPKFMFDPCEYGGWLTPPGDAYTKRTCLWGEFNAPPQRPVEPIEGSKMHLVSSGPNQAAIRSETPRGFARAFYEANP